MRNVDIEWEVCITVSQLLLRRTLEFLIYCWYREFFWGRAEIVYCCNRDERVFIIGNFIFISRVKIDLLPLESVGLGNFKVDVMSNGRLKIL